MVTLESPGYYDYHPCWRRDSDGGGGERWRSVNVLFTLNSSDDVVTSLQSSHLSIKEFRDVIILISYCYAGGECWITK